MSVYYELAHHIHDDDFSLWLTDTSKPHNKSAQLVVNWRGEPERDQAWHSATWPDNTEVVVIDEATMTALHMRAVHKPGDAWQRVARQAFEPLFTRLT